MAWNREMMNGRMGWNKEMDKWKNGRMASNREMDKWKKGVEQRNG